MQQTLDAAARREGREAADGIGVLVEDARGHFLALRLGAETMARQGRLQQTGGAQHLALGQLLALRFEGGAALQLRDVFRSEYLGGSADGGNQHLILRHQRGLQSVAAKGLEAASMHFVGRCFQDGLDDAGTEADAVEAGTLGELAEEESQSARLLSSLVAPQGVAGPAERPVGVELAEDVVLVGAQQVNGQGRHGEDVADGGRFVVLAEGDMAEVGQKTRRRQVVAARRDLQRPFQYLAHVRRTRRRHPLPPQALQQETAGLVGIAQFVSTHNPQPAVRV